MTEVQGLVSSTGVCWQWLRVLLAVQECVGSGGGSC